MQTFRWWYLVTLKRKVCRLNYVLKKITIKKFSAENPWFIDISCSHRIALFKVSWKKIFKAKKQMCRTENKFKLWFLIFSQYDLDLDWYDDDLIIFCDFFPRVKIEKDFNYSKVYFLWLWQRLYTKIDINDISKDNSRLDSFQ
jgi:hypothetical protein